MFSVSIPTLDYAGLKWQTMTATYFDATNGKYNVIVYNTISARITQSLFIALSPRAFIFHHLLCPNNLSLASAYHYTTMTNLTKYSSILPMFRYFPSKSSIT